MLCLDTGINSRLRGGSLGIKGRLGEVSQHKKKSGRVSSLPPKKPRQFHILIFTGRMSHSLIVFWSSSTRHGPLATPPEAGRAPGVEQPLQQKTEDRQEDDHSVHDKDSSYEDDLQPPGTSD